MKLGATEREILASYGHKITESSMFKLTFANLRQLQEFAFASGTESVLVSQDTIGLTFRVKGGDIAKFVEATGYVINARSITIGTKEFIIDARDVFSIKGEERRIAGVNAVGAEVKAKFALSSATDPVTLDVIFGQLKS